MKNTKLSIAIDDSKVIFPLVYDLMKTHLLSGKSMCRRISCSKDH